MREYDPAEHAHEIRMAQTDSARENGCPNEVWSEGLDQMIPCTPEHPCDEHAVGPEPTDAPLHDEYDPDMDVQWDWETGERV